LPLPSPLFPYTTLFRSLEFLRLLGALVVQPPRHFDVFTPRPVKLGAQLELAFVGALDLVEPFGGARQVLKRALNRAAVLALQARSEEHTSELQSLRHLV